MDRSAALARLRTLGLHPRSTALVVSVALVLALATWLLGSRSVDFLSFYSAGASVVRGEAAHLYDREYLRLLQQPWTEGPHLGGVFPYFYAPAFALLYVPLALLPMTVARLLWGVISVLLLAWALRISRTWSGLGWPATLWITLALPPLYISMYLLHMSPLLLLLFAALASFESRNRVGVGAGMLAGVLLLKPHLLLPLAVVWLGLGRLRALAGLAGAAAVVVATSLLVSVAGSLAYLTTLTGSFSSGLRSLQTHRVNLTLYSGLDSLLPPRVALAVSAALALVVLGALLVAWRRTDRRGPYHHAMLWSAPLLVTPYLGAYDLVLLFVPVTFLFTRLTRDRPLLWIVLVSWGLQIAMITVKAAHVALIPWTTLLLFGLCFRRAVAPDPDYS